MLFRSLAEDLEIKTTLAVNRCVQFAKPTLDAHPGVDTTKPSVFIPQRWPYNPGEKGYGAPYAYKDFLNSADFTVYTFAYDVSGIQKSELKYRIDVDGKNTVASNQNEIYAGGSEVGAWISLPMTERVFPKGNFTNSTQADLYMLPDVIASQYSAEIAGISEKLLDYYIEVTDKKGNKTKSKIQHVWVGKNLDVAPKVAFTPDAGNSTVALDITITATDSTDPKPKLYYTTDGTTPTLTSSFVESTKTITVSKTTTIKAFAVDKDGNSTEIITKLYTIGAIPEFTVYFKKPANWNAAVKVYYWLPTGTAPVAAYPGVAMTKDCGDWYKYTFPSTVTSSNLLFNDGTLKTADLTANAGIKYYDSAWLTAEPTNRCPVIAPDFTNSQAGGTFTTGTTANVILTANESTSTLYYTLDGTIPTTASASSLGSKTFAITSTTTLKVFVKNTAGVSSAIKTETYTFNTPNTFTVYFKKPTSWSTTVKVYYWSTTGAATAVTYPGVAMTKDCGEWYKYTFPSTVSATNLLFNDGNLKTGNLTAIAGIKYYDSVWLSAEPTNRCPVIVPDFTNSKPGGTFTTGTSVNVILTANETSSTIYYTLDGTNPTTSSASAIGTKSFTFTANTALKAFVKNTSGVVSAVKTEVYNFSAATTLTVYFKPPTSWTTTPKIHYWNTVPSGSATNTTWPGVPMVADTNGFFKYTITGPTSVNIIFNNGSSGSANQTPNLLNKTNGYSYTWGVTTAKMGSKSTVTPEEETYLIRLYPNPVNETLQISSTSTLSSYSIISAQGSIVQEGKLNEGSIDVSRLSVGLYFVTIRLENGTETMQKIIKK